MKGRFLPRYRWLAKHVRENDRNDENNGNNGPVHDQVLVALIEAL